MKRNVKAACIENRPSDHLYKQKKRDNSIIRKPIETLSNMRIHYAYLHPLYQEFFLIRMTLILYYFSHIPYY